MSRLLWICLAGALGTGVRYLVGLWASRAFGSAFPYGTLAVNVVGCFLIAAVMHASLATALVPPTLRLALTSGFLGGLTTYSSFNYETTALAQRGQIAVALANVGITLIGCLAMGALGLWVARRVT